MVLRFPAAPNAGVPESGEKKERERKEEAPARFLRIQRQQTRIVQLHLECSGNKTNYKKGIRSRKPQ